MRSGPLSVTELNEYVRRSLAGDPMLQGIAIRGEINNFKRHTSGHLYFSLKDENSRIACVMFRQHAMMLRFQPQDGMQVILSGSAGLYTASGSYQFYGEAMSSDGAGVLYEQFLRIKERLQKEGLFDAALKKPLPLMPRAIGIVTSGSGAVLHDIITVARRRFPAARMILRAAQVQGEGAALDITKGIREIAELDDVEVIIIGRGGGSLEDLWAFNEEVLVRAVAACEKPIISAVGHETDVTLTDFAADVRAATPSAAAEIAIPSKAELMGRINGMRERFLSVAEQCLEKKRADLIGLTGRISQHDPVHLLRLAQSRRDMMEKRLRTAAWAGYQLLLSAATGAVDRFKLSGPEQTLRRGYVIAFSQGKPVQFARQAEEEMDLMFQDGRVKVRTLDIQLNAQEEKDGQENGNAV